MADPACLSIRTETDSQAGSAAMVSFFADRSPAARVGVGRDD
jgi:hypothetical protein